ncbi:pyrroloquinoline quinone biosynthesis protein PqqF [Pantoea sp. FN060301]|uniref:pyrroloquinoline quinone biosynthesis protein PqqF n=1 Tax=Pantoea sp. FN060301 TaxID=3420380 RepID=UPI003D17F3D7
MAVVQRRLANGLLVNLIQDPGATQASALVRLSAGSLHEPDAWPGLAHLLEHVLFAGSERFQDEERLMAWVPAKGGRLNATTRANSTAWFVEVAAPDLADAAARLVDMLQRPLLTTDAIRQEAAAIEAEYRMLAAHQETLCEAALSQAFAAPHPLHRFQVGSQTHFGQDLPALRQALRAYHQHYFHTARLTLWLQGPQPLAELLQLAEACGGEFQRAALPEPCGFPAVDSAPYCAQAPTALPASAWPAALALRPERHFRLQLPGAERLQLSFLIASPDPRTFSLLQELLCDTASHTLLGTLREQGLCDEIDLLEPYRSDAQAIISVLFHLCDTPGDGRAEKVPASAVVEAIFCRWLDLLSGLSAEQLRHYAALSHRRFVRLSSLDRLRARAFGRPPADERTLASGAWQQLLTQLQPDNMTRLWISPQAVSGRIVAQGFMLNLSAECWPVNSDLAERVGLGFADRPLPVPPSLPAERAPLRHLPATCDAVLLLTPVAGELSPAQAALIEASLQTVSGACHHQGGELHFESRQGSWLLRLSGSRELMLAAIDEVNSRLHSPTSAGVARGQRLALRAARQQRTDIAVRALLAKLPLAITHRQLAGDNAQASASAPRAGKMPDRVMLDDAAFLPETDLPRVRWEATLYGGDEPLYQALSRLLSRFPGELIVQPPSRSPSAEPALKQAVAAREATHYLCPTESPDAAVLLFCPLAEASASCLAAWQLFGALFEPRFFQQLRVEKPVGYVVSCRFHQSAGSAGLLFALQSPSLSAEELYRHMQEFIAGMGEVVGQISPDSLQKKARTLRLVEATGQPESPAAVLNAWQKQQLQLPALTQEELNGLTPDRLSRYYQTLAGEPGRWIRISNQ